MALFISFGLKAQNPEDLILSKNLYIQDIQIKTSPSAPLFKGDIYIKNGIIEKVGSSIPVPKDAIIIKGDSLFAYPGFIAVYTQAGIPKEKDKKQEKVKDPDNPGYERAGITPQKSVDDSIDLTDKNLEEYRKQGYTIAHVVLKKGMLSGQGSVYSLNTSSTNPIIKKDCSLNGSFESAKGRVYPSTVIAVIAKYKNLFNQAAIDYSYQEKYKKSPVGLVRPTTDPEIESLFPVINNGKAFYFQAEKTLDISRALQLKKDISSISGIEDIEMVLCNVKQGYSHSEKLAKNDIAVLASLDLPDTVKVEKKDSVHLKDSSYALLLDRKKKSIADYRNQCKTFQDAGVNYNFSYIDTDPDKIQNALSVIHETGVSKEVLLSKLTLEAASQLGIDKIAGTIEKGKLANLILMTEPFMEKDAHIKHTIIEGHVYDYDKKEKKKEKSESLEGSWSMETDIAGSTESATLKLKKNDETWEGKLDYAGETMDAQDLKIEDDMLSFSFDLEVENAGTVKAKFQASIDKNEIKKGELTIPGMGKFPVTISTKPN